MENTDKTYHLELLDIVVKQEESLQPDHFDAADTWQLGLILRDLGLEIDADMALHITLLGAQVFHSGLGHPKPNFDHWIARKERGTLVCWKSSQRLKLEALCGGNQLENHGFTAIRRCNHSFTGPCDSYTKACSSPLSTLRAPSASASISFSPG